MTQVSDAINGLDGNGLLKTNALSMEGKMAAGALGRARNYGWRPRYVNLPSLLLFINKCHVNMLWVPHLWDSPVLKNDDLVHLGKKTDAVGHQNSGLTQRQKHNFIEIRTNPIPYLKKTDEIPPKLCKNSCVHPSTHPTSICPSIHPSIHPPTYSVYVPTKS